LSGIEKFKGKRENFIFNTFIYFEPVNRFKNRSRPGMTKLYTQTVLYVVRKSKKFGRIFIRDRR